MARPYLYHVYDGKDFGKPFSSAVFPKVPSHVFVGETESKAFYSLKRDMDALRSEGAAKGIVDASVTRVGLSHEKRDLCALKVGKGSAHKVLIVGCTHAREWVSVEVPYYTAEYLIRNFTPLPETEEEKRVNHLLTNREIWFVPMVNPDGHAHSVVEDRGWRAGRTPHALKAATITANTAWSDKTRVISYPEGIYYTDLNRNYPTKEGGQETFVGRNVRTSRDPRDHRDGHGNWTGPSQASDPEVQAIVALMKKEKFGATCTCHSYGMDWLYPDAAGVDKFFTQVGLGLVSLIHEHAPKYQYLRSYADFYPTTGDMMDYCWETLPGRPTFTPELRPDNNSTMDREFSGLPEEDMAKDVIENLPALLALINSAAFEKPSGPHKVAVKYSEKPVTVQVVQDCVRVFRGWKPWASSGEPPS